jgi:hypothetical protein
MKTLHHYGGIIFDTTGGYGNGFSIALLGASGFTVGNTTDTTANDPYMWIATYGGTGTTSISNDNGSGTETGINILLSNISPYSVPADFHFCKFEGTLNHGYAVGNTLPKTCGNI